MFLYSGDYAQDDLDKWTAWYQSSFPFNVVFTTRAVSVSLTFKKFLTITDPTTHQPRDLYGLDGIKAQLAPYVEMGQYHEVKFYYPRESSHPDTANWTYPNDLNGAVFTELTSTPEWDAQDNFYKNLRHEQFHTFIRCLWLKNIIVQDDLDLYDYPANETRNLARIAPYFDRLGEQPLGKYIVYLQGILATLQAAVAALGTKVGRWASAVQQYEGFYPGSRSYKNNNPGNLRFTNYTVTLGATGKDKDNFAVFPSYAVGRKALERLLIDAATDKLALYKSTMTLFDFQAIYSPAADQNDPNSYALYVSRKLGVPPQTQIKTLV